MGKPRDNWQYWLWKIQTKKGDFFMSVYGEWNQEEAAKKVRTVFGWLKLEIIAMIPRKRDISSTDNAGTILQQEPPKDALGFDFMAGKKLWDVSGRTAEYDAEMVLLKKQGG